MTARSRILVAIALSLVWGAAFVVAVDAGALYPIMGPCAALLAVVVLWLSPTMRGALRLPPSRWAREVGLGAVVGGVTVVFTQVGFRACGEYLPGFTVDVHRLYQVAQVTPARLAVVVLIAATEELIWRGFVLDALRQGRPPGKASDVVVVVVAALIYGVSQVGPASAWLVVAAVGLGGLWGAMRVVLRSLWMPIAAHLVWTVTILGLWPLPGN